MAVIDGEVEPGFGPVADAFAGNFDNGREVGAAFCLYAGGRPVVDVWGGTADKATARPWDRDTLQLVFSTTKGVTAVCAHMLAERGVIDLDAPVTDYWPEFEAEGKQDIPVRWLMAHRAGLPYVDVDLTLDDVIAWTPVVEALAAQKPVWEPGTAHGYHALTYGWLIGEVMRRAAGITPAQFVAAELVPALDLELWIGLPASLESRVSHIEAAKPEDNPEMAAILRQLLESGSPLMRAITLGKVFTAGVVDPTGDAVDFNSRAVHAAEIPAGNGITTARSLARLYAATVGEVDGVRLLSPATVEDARAPQSTGPSFGMGDLPSPTFATGFMVHSDVRPMLGPTSFGHDGAGGSLAFADVDSGIGYAYVMNQMVNSGGVDPRTLDLLAAVRSCV